MYHCLLVIFLLVAVAIVSMIMLQQSKSSGISSSFNAGLYNTLLSSNTYANIFTRIITILTILFFLLSLVLGNLSNNHRKDISWKDINQEKSKYKLLTKSSLKLNNELPR